MRVECLFVMVEQNENGLVKTLGGNSYQSHQCVKILNKWNAAKKAIGKHGNLIQKAEKVASYKLFLVLADSRIRRENRNIKIIRFAKMSFHEKYFLKRN